MKTKLFKFLLTTILIINITSSTINPDNVVVAINCGGDDFKDSNGVQYEKDNYYDVGQTSDFGSQFEIKLTTNQDLYQTERWASEDINYKVPFPNSPGRYVLILKFSEVYFNSANEKVFDVLLGGEPVVRNVDIYSKVGKAAAYDEFIEFELKNSKIYIKNKLALNAFNEENNKLSITFKKGERDNPKINAILIVKGGISDTDYDAYKSQFEEFERLQMEKERKQREFKKITPDVDFEDFEDDYVDIGASRETGYFFLRPGFIIITGIGAVALYFLLGRSRDDKEE